MESEEKFKEGIVTHSRRLGADLRMMIDRNYDLGAFAGLKFDEAQVKTVVSDLYRYLHKIANSLREIDKVINNEKSKTDNP